MYILMDFIFKNDKKLQDTAEDINET